MPLAGATLDVVLVCAAVATIVLGVEDGLALAFIGAMEGAVIELSGHEPHDEELAARAAAGVLGIR